MSQSHNALPLWEIEVRVLDLVAEQIGIPRSSLGLDQRLIEDLHIDSLEIVELMLALEETFDVTIPDDVSRLPFISGAVTLGDLARVVQHQLGTGHLARKGWFVPKPKPHASALTSFTQLGGSMGEKEWRSLSLYDELTPVHENVRQFFRRTDGMRCVLIPPALVELGSTAPDSLPDQGPRHTANLAGFLIDAEPVSTTAYARFLNSTGASPEAEKTWCGVDSDDRRKVHFQLERNGKMWRPKPGTERQPIVLVSWFGATAYSLWANRREWKESAPFLPTEAQWEYAARGAKWQLFPWGSDPCMPDRAVVGLHTARAKYSNLLPLADVSAELGLSPFGLRHMAGNVWNWCRDWYAPDFYRNPEATGHNPEQPKNTGIRSERGGSWIGPGALAASSYRRGRPPHARGRCLGFRCIGHPPDMARR